MRWRLMAWSTFVVGVTAAALLLIARTDPGFNNSGSGVAGDGSVLRAGYALEAPYAFRDAQGMLRGEAIDTLRAALQRAGLPEPVWVHLEFARLLHELRSGRIDIIAAGMFITQERAALAAFTRPTTSVRTGLLVAKGNPLGLHSLDDVRRAAHAPLAVLDGSVELAQAREAGLVDAQLLRMPDTASAVAALRSGHAAAFMLSTQSLRWMLGESPTLEMATPFATPQRGGRPDIGYPAYVFRQGDPRRERLNQALSGHLGSAEHLRSVAIYGFSAEDVAAAHGMDPAKVK